MGSGLTGLFPYIMITCPGTTIWVCMPLGNFVKIHKNKGRSVSDELELCRDAGLRSRMAAASNFPWTLMF